MKDTDIQRIEPERILICQLRQIGDVILSTIVVRLLNRRWPGAEIHVLTESKCVPVLENNPRISRIIPLKKDRLKNPFKALAFYRSTGRGYDLLVDLQQLPKLRFVAGFSDAPVKLTFTPPWYNRPWYTHWSKARIGYAGMCKASLLAPLGIEWDGKGPEMYLTDEERSWADAFLKKSGLEAKDTLVTLDPTHKRLTRIWPARYYGELLNRALEARPDLRIYVIYGPREGEDAAKVVRACAYPERIILPERTGTLRQAAAVIERASLHLGNCSAPRHMAVALSTSSLTIQGGNSADWLFPSPDHEQLFLGLDCQPCNRETCPKEYECVRDFTPDMVLPELLSRLDRLG